MQFPKGELPSLKTIINNFIDNLNKFLIIVLLILIIITLFIRTFIIYIININALKKTKNI